MGRSDEGLRSCCPFLQGMTGLYDKKAGLGASVLGDMGVLGLFFGNAAAERGFFCTTTGHQRIVLDNWFVMTDILHRMAFQKAGSCSLHPKTGKAALQIACAPEVC